MSNILVRTQPRAPGRNRLAPCRVASTVIGFALLLAAGCGGVGDDEMMRVARLRQQINAQNSSSEAPPTGADEAAAEPAEAKPKTSSPAQPKPGTPAAKKPRAPSAPAPKEPVDSKGEPEARSAFDPVDQSSENLLDIADALQAMSQQGSRKRFPTNFDRDDERGNLSWRVHLLPYLGYDDLYKQFDLKKNWDKPPNLALADQIPEIYQSDGVTGQYTRYLGVIGKAGIMGGDDPVDHHKVTDGLENTVLVVEVDSPKAAIWTQPVDFNFSGAGSLRKIGGLRGGYAYAVWADGNIAALDLSKSRRLLSAVFDYKGGVPVDRASVIVPFDAKKMAAGTPRPARRSSQVAADVGPSSGAASEGAPPVYDEAPGISDYADSLAPNQLAGSCLSAAQLSRSEGGTTAAWNWLYGAVLADLPASAWADDMKWVPALRRPSLGMHWAVGVAVRSSAARRSADPLAPPRAKRDELNRVSAPFGEPLLTVIEKAAKSTEPSALRTADAMALPAMTYLPVSSSIADLVNDASETGADVLVVFSIESNASGRAGALDLIIYDVMQRSQLKRLGRIESRTLKDSETNRESAREVRWALSDYVEDSLTPGEWPVQLSAKLATKRVRSLGQMDSSYPPRQMVEMRYYRNLNLVDDAQLLRGVNALIGGEQGVNLLLGNNVKKRRVIRPWLPDDDPATYIAATERRQRANEDDDD